MNRFPSRLWCAAALLVAFASLGVVAHVAGRGTAPDHAVLGSMIEHRRDWLTSIAIVITNAGSPVVIGLAASIVAMILWWRRRTPIPGLAVLGTLAVAAGTSTVTKMVIGARRPPQPVQLLLEVDPSFPSGHVTGMVALLGIVAVALGRGRGVATRLALIAAVVVAVLAVACTRLYLGVHWLTDVGGGILLGSAAVIIGSLPYEAAAPPRARTVVSPATAVASRVA